MADDDKLSKRKKYLEAYVSTKDMSHKHAFTPPPDTHRVELPTLMARSKGPGTVPKTPPRERLPIREMAMKRSRPSYLRDDVEVPPEDRKEHAETDRPSDDKRRPFLYRRRSGFKLVKDGMDRRRPGGTAQERSKRKLSLYDLYATHSPGEEEEAPTEDREGATLPDDPEEEVDPSAFRREAQDILFGPKHGAKEEKHPEGPILKEGPGPFPARQEDEVMGAGTMIEPEHEQAIEESPVHVDHDEGPAPLPEPASLVAKTAGGEICPSCGEAFGPYNKLLICTSCGEKRCHRCNQYDLEHAHSNVFYEYKFDFPLCIQCYDKAFKVQKLLGKSHMCYGNGNLTYALYYAQNALRMAPDDRYKDDVERMMQKIQEARERREAHDQSWKQQYKNMSRAKFQDPSWGK